MCTFEHKFTLPFFDVVFSSYTCRQFHLSSHTYDQGNFQGVCHLGQFFMEQNVKIN